jgi:hypothetical protein
MDVTELKVAFRKIMNVPKEDCSKNQQVELDFATL